MTSACSAVPTPVIVTLLAVTGAKLQAPSEH